MIHHSKFKNLLFLDFFGQYLMDPGEILRGHHISNFGKEITRDNRLLSESLIVSAELSLSRKGPLVMK